jgi:hypothetical protein
VDVSHQAEPRKTLLLLSHSLSKSFILTTTSAVGRNVILTCKKTETERKFLGFPKYCHVIFAAPTHFHLSFPSI